MKKVYGIYLFLSVLALATLQCTQVKYNNPLDSNGTNYAGDSLAMDDNNNGIANYYDDDDGDGIPNYKDPDYKHYHQTDFTKPVISFVGGDTVIVALDDPKHVLAVDTVIAIDNVDGNITAKVQKPDIFTSQCSTYNVIYRVSDVAGNAAEKGRTVIVDCNPPVITLHGDNPMSLHKGTAYVEPGAEARDDVDGVLPASRITTTGTVNSAVVGVDTVTYTASDRAGNIATKKRVVSITVEADTMPPHLVLNPPLTMTVWKDSAFVDPGYTATDNVDGDIHTKVVVTGGPINTHALGTDTLTYTVADQAGNVVTQKRIVKIQSYVQGKDTIPPVITLIGSGDTSILVGSTWKDPGATAYDNVDLDVTSKITVHEQNNKTITTVAPGNYMLLYDVSDKAGNPAEVGRIVRVTGKSQDTTPPVIALKGCVACSTSQGTQFTDPGDTAYDNVDGNLTDSVKRVVTNKTSGAIVQYASFYQTVGVYNFTYSVYDKSGNPAIPVVRQVTVKDTASPGNLLAKYGVPLAAALPTVNTTYKTSITTDGATAPNVSNITSFVLNWDLPNKSIYQFALNFKAAPYYSNFSPTNTFSAAGPTFTLTGSGITGLDGDYYINATATQCVWVRKDGSFAIIFK